MTGTSDPINVAAEKLLMVLEEHDELIDAAAIATYEGDWLQDLTNGDVEGVIRATSHGEETYAKVARALASKLEADAKRSESFV